MAVSLWFVVRVSKTPMSLSLKDGLWAVTWLVALVLPYPGTVSQSVPSTILPASSSTPTPGCLHELTWS